jgi:hypothetical protein
MNFITFLCPPGIRIFLPPFVPVFKELTAKQASSIYADEADVLNMALFGITAADCMHP